MESLTPTAPRSCHVLGEKSSGPSTVESTDLN